MQNMILTQRRQHGNLINDTLFLYEYDSFNKLITVKNQTSAVFAEYAYNHEGTRIRKIEYQGGNQSNNETTIYVSDSFVVVINSSGTFNYTYYYLNDQLVAAKAPDGAKTYYHSDHLGSTTLVTNQSGDIVEENFYEPFGQIYSGEEESRYLYTGQELDQDTDLYYYGARYYDPSKNQFIQPDPLIQDIYTPADLNRYAYVRNNPYKYTDPSGNAAFPYHFAGSYLGLREIGYSIPDSFKLAVDSIIPDFNINDKSYYREEEGYRDYHLAVEISNEDKEVVLTENAVKFQESYQRGDKDAGRYLHVFGDTIHQGGPSAGPEASLREIVSHVLRDANPKNIITTRNNIVTYIANQVDAQSQSASQGAAKTHFTITKPSSQKIQASQTKDMGKGTKILSYLRSRLKL